MDKHLIRNFSIIAHIDHGKSTKKDQAVEFTNSNLKSRAGDILLVSLPPWGVENPPVGLGYLASYLKYRGLKALVLDLNIEVFNRVSAEDRIFWEARNLDCWRVKNKFQELLKKDMEKQLKHCIDRILSTDLDIVGFSINRANLRFAIEIVKRIRKSKAGLTIIFGGHSCSLEGERNIVPENLVDVFIIGEGEEVLWEVLRNIKKGDRLDEIPGVLNPGIDKFIPREFIKDLSTLPFPTYQEFDLAKYGNKPRSLSIATSRGCVRNCVFCNDVAVWGGRFRYRSAHHIFKEIKYHTEINNINFFEFCDLACNGNLAQLELLTDLLISSKYKIKWIGNMMVRSDITGQLLRKMKDSGCEALRYGIESGSNTILEKMKKGFKVWEAEHILKMSYDAGIKNHINLIVGFPSEDKIEFNQTIDFLKRNRQFIHQIANIFPFYLTPGSKIERDYERYGIILPTGDFVAINWHDGQGNNFEQRIEKVKKLASAASNLGIVSDSSVIWSHDEEVFFGHVSLGEKNEKL